MKKPLQHLAVAVVISQPRSKAPVCMARSLAQERNENGRTQAAGLATVVVYLGLAAQTPLPSEPVQVDRAKLA